MSAKADRAPCRSASIYQIYIKNHKRRHKPFMQNMQVRTPRRGPVCAEVERSSPADVDNVDDDVSSSSQNDRRGECPPRHSFRYVLSLSMAHATSFPRSRLPRAVIFRVASGTGEMALTFSSSVKACSLSSLAERPSTSSARTLSSEQTHVTLPLASSPSLFLSSTDQPGLGRDRGDQEAKA